LSADLKNQTVLNKNRQKSKLAERKTDNLFIDMVDKNIDLTKTVKQLSSELLNEKAKSRKLQKRVAKIKRQKQRHYIFY